MINLSMTKEARIYNGEKTVPSINNTEKIKQLHVKENEIRTFSNTMYKNKLFDPNLIYRCWFILFRNFPNFLHYGYLI